jgi:hypothetical protein
MTNPHFAKQKELYTPALEYSLHLQGFAGVFDVSMSVLRRPLILFNRSHVEDYHVQKPRCRDRGRLLFISHFPFDSHCRSACSGLVWQ